MSDGIWGFDTKKVHAGSDPDKHASSTLVPIYQTASFELGSMEHAESLFSGKEAGYSYSRLGNPTVAALEVRAAALEGGVEAVAFATGMAAMSSLLLCLAEGGGRVLSSPHLYGGSFCALRDFLPRFGVHCDFAPSLDPEAIRKALQPGTKAILVESVSNPGCAVADIEAIAAIAHSHGVPLVVDNTLLTPALKRPLELGADLVVHSATKALSGHGSALAGIVVDGGRFEYGRELFPQFHEASYSLRDRTTKKERSFVEVFPRAPLAARLRKSFLPCLGAALGPMDAYLVLLGIETLSERVTKQSANAKRMAAFLASHPRVSALRYPGMGGLLSFDLEAGEEERSAFVRALRVVSYQPNIGDARTLIIDPARVTHDCLRPDELAASGIRPETFRISAGLEAADDLVADLGRALDTALGKERL